MIATESSYQKLCATGELEKRAEEAWSKLADCTLCPWKCHVNRLAGKLGVCKTGGLRNLLN